MDGREVHSVENTNPKTFTNIRVFAGDKSKPAADASYRNLSWKNFYVDHSFNVGAKILENKEIGTIEIWGPFFRLSFDLIVHSLRQVEWSSILEVRENGASCPVLRFNNELSEINFACFYYNGTDGVEVLYYFNFKIELNHWYNIIIEQKVVNMKVILDKTENKLTLIIFDNLVICQEYHYTVSIDGKLIRSFPITKPRTFNDMKVFAGDNFDPAADASYKNLVWENLPLPDIMFNVDTPSIVSIDNEY